VRISDWIETASGTPVIIKTGYTFTSPVQPTHDYDNTFGALLTSSPSGKLLIEGRTATGSPGVAVLINAIRLVAQPVIRITNAQLVNGNIRLTVETQYPQQSISFEQNADLKGTNWVSASGGSIAETHGPIVTADFPANTNQLFYRVVSQ